MLVYKEGSNWVHKFMETQPGVNVINVPNGENVNSPWINTYAKIAIPEGSEVPENPAIYYVCNRGNSSENTVSQNRPSSVSVIAITYLKGKPYVIVNCQFRVAISSSTNPKQGYEISFPAGLCEFDENGNVSVENIIKKTVKNELDEEAGATVVSDDCKIVSGGAKSAGAINEYEITVITSVNSNFHEQKLEEAEKGLVSILVPADKLNEFYIECIKEGVMTSSIFGATAAMGETLINKYIKEHPNYSNSNQKI